MNLLKIFFRVNTRDAISNPIDDIFAIYKISFFWYAPFGFVITFLLGIILSVCMVDKARMEKINPSLVSAAAQFLIPKQYRQISVNAVNEARQTYTTVKKETTKNIIDEM